MEITGPTDRKMTINALNSGAKVWLADLEDANTPLGRTWSAASSTCATPSSARIDFTAPEGKAYALGATTSSPTIVVRPRGWHLAEKHLERRRRAAVRLAGRLRPVLLPLRAAADRPRARARTSTCRRWSPTSRPGSGTTSSSSRRTCSASRRAPSARPCLIETIPAAFEMEEILYELRDHSAGLNAGRWDYLFSVIKNFRTRGARVRAAGPQRGDHDRPVHARLHRAAGPHLPQARRARDRRHGGVHPVAARPGGQRGRLRRRSRPTRTARPATASTAPGWPTPAWCRSAARSSTRCSATGRTSSTGCARTSHVTAAELLDVRSDARATSPRPGCATTSASPCSTSSLAARSGRGRPSTT